MKILDSRNGMANAILAKINGTGHHIVIKTSDDNFIPETLSIKLAVSESYGNFSAKDIMHATNIKLDNQTMANVLVYPGAENLDVSSKGEVKNMSSQKK